MSVKFLKEEAISVVDEISLFETEAGVTLPASYHDFLLKLKKGN